jgi:anti-anti-sigma factor
MDFSSRSFADVVVATPTGRIDHTAAPRFEEALLPLIEGIGVDRRALLLDFSGVEYISSVGLRVLMVAGKRMHAKNAPLAIGSLRPVVAEIFAISRFDSILKVFPGMREALAALSPAALEAFERG